MTKTTDLYQQRYGLTAPHSEVINILEKVSMGRALDLGSGRGRNSLLLQQSGFEVDAIDHNPKAIEVLKDIISKEGLDGITAKVGKVQDLAPTAVYDLVISTVVLMFLCETEVPRAIAAMQQATAPGGRNLIVSAIDCPEHPFAAHELPFGFGFGPGELANYYQHWSIEHYDENLGHLHRRDAHGNRIALRFATLVAQRPQ